VTVPLEELQQRLGVVFRDRELLVRALTHPSWTEEHGDLSYQRLEFLGDSVLGFIVADLVHSRFPDKPEGDLTRMKWALVSGTTLSAVGRGLGLDSALRLGRGAERDRDRDSVLEASFEALVGAVYLDAGLTTARRVVLDALADRLADDALASTAVPDPKGALQEYAQSRGLGLPSYRIVSSEGPAHDPLFVSEVTIGEQVRGSGTGQSKQSAEREAALAALERLMAKAAPKG